MANHDDRTAEAAQPGAGEPAPSRGASVALLVFYDKLAKVQPACDVLSAAIERGNPHVIEQAVHSLAGSWFVVTSATALIKTHIDKHVEQEYIARRALRTARMVLLDALDRATVEILTWEVGHADRARLFDLLRSLRAKIDIV
jgi:hypothetical protein